MKILVVSTEKSDTSTMEDLILNPVFRNSHSLIYTFKNKQSFFWDVFSLLLHTMKQRQTVARINSWSMSSGFSSSSPLYSPSTKKNFMGYDFTVAALPYSPFVIIENTSTNRPGRYRGIEIDLLNVVATYANFTFHFVAPEDGQWGKELEDGSWTGLIGMVAREEADFAISDIAPSLMRLLVVDFSDIFIFDASELITPRALPLPLWQGPIRPFSHFVWTAIVVSFLIASIFIYWISVAFTLNKKNVWFMSFGHCIMYAMVPLFMRGHKTEYKGTPGRIFICIWLACAMIISIFYTSSLTSFLILPGYTRPIQNLEELVTSSIGWAKVDFGGLQNELLEKATDPLLKALGRGVEWRKDLDGILKQVVKGEIATWENAITTNLKVAVQYSDNNGQPLVHFTGYALLQERISWPIQKNAPFKDRFNIMINRVVESGLMNKFFKDIVNEEQRKQKKERKIQMKEENSGSKTVLNIDHFQGPFFIMFVGYFLGFIALVFEVVSYKLRK